MAIVLNWANRVVGDSIKIYRSESPFNATSLPAPFATLSAQANSYTDEVAVVGVPYYYAVGVFSGASVAATNTISITPGSGDLPLKDQVLALYVTETGFVYDPSDLTSLFQDHMGRTPVTADGDPVALVLDQIDKTGTTGSELVTNGDFPTDTTGWSATNATLSVTGGVLKVTNTGAAGAAYQSISTTPGKFYKISFEVVSFDANTARISVNDGGSFAFTGSIFAENISSDNTGVYTWYFRARSVTTTIAFMANTTTTNEYIEYDNISVLECVGCHAIQDANTSYRPTYKVDGDDNSYLDFDGSDDYLRIPWAHFAPASSEIHSLCVAFDNQSFETNNSNVILSGGFGGDQDGFMLQIEDFSTAAAELNLLNDSSNNLWLDGEVAAENDAYSAATPHVVVAESTINNQDNGDHFIGAHNNSTNFTDANIYGVAMISGALADSDRNTIESWLAELSGAELP